MLLNRREAGLMLASVLAHGPAVAQGGAGQATRTLKMVPHAVLRLLDPVGTSAYITRNHGYLIYDTLFGFDEKFMPQPQMVGNWNVSGDGLVYTFTLRDGLRFHDGAPVTSDDCIASLSRWMKSDMTGERLARSVKEMAAVDAKTFKIVLNAPFASMLEALAKPSTNVPFIMPKRVVEAADKGGVSRIRPGRVRSSSSPRNFVQASRSSTSETQIMCLARSRPTISRAASLPSLIASNG